MSLTQKIAHIEKNLSDAATGLKELRLHLEKIESHINMADIAKLVQFHRIFEDLMTASASFASDLKPPTVKEAATKAEPVKAEPVKAEPVKAEPVKAEPLKSDAAKPVAKQEPQLGALGVRPTLKRRGAPDHARPWSNEDRKLAKDMYMKGKSIEEIGKAVGRSPTAVRVRLGRDNVVRP